MNYSTILMNSDIIINMLHWPPPPGQTNNSNSNNTSQSSPKTINSFPSSSSITTMTTISIILLFTIVLYPSGAYSQFHPSTFNHLNANTHSVFEHLRNNNNNNNNFNTMQFSFGSFTPPTAAPTSLTFPSFGTPAALNGSTPGITLPITPTATTTTTSRTITATPIPQDRTTRTFQPNVFNAGSNSTTLNEALKWYTDEEFRLAVEKIELMNEQALLQGSPRSLQDASLKQHSETIPGKLTAIDKAESKSQQEVRSLPMAGFVKDLAPPPSSLEPSTTSTTPATAGPQLPSFDDLPSPALLLNPGVQDQIRNSTSLLSDLKDIFTPSQSTQSVIRDLSKNAPSANEVTSSLSSISKPPTSSSSSSSSPSPSSLLPSLPRPSTSNTIKPPSSTPTRSTSSSSRPTTTVTRTPTSASFSTGSPFGFLSDILSL